MESALRYELENRIPELAGQIYPAHAPETATKPYLVYTRINTLKTKTLEGYTDKQALSYMFSCMATKYPDMKSLSNKVEAFLMSIPGTTIGEESIYVEDLGMNNITETWEPELKVNRGIIDFTIYI
jgi:hypothetical protein